MRILRKNGKITKRKIKEAEKFILSLSKRMKVFAGSSNPKLARKIAQALKVKLGQVELSRFPNHECRVWIKEPVTNNKVVVVQSFSSPPDEYLVQFCLMIDALKREGVKKIIAVIPWLGYCIQDKVFRPGEPLSSKVMVKILQSLKINRLITIDLHNETVSGFFDIPFTLLSADEIFLDYFSKKRRPFDTIVSPDVGGLKGATKFAELFKLPLVVVNKQRDLSSGKVKILSINEVVKGKRALIVDDFVSTGSTLVHVASFLKEKGVKKVSACLAHHFYVPGVQEKIEKSALDKLFVTDSIQPPERKKYKKLTIVSSANLIAQAIKKYQ